MINHHELSRRCFIQSMLLAVAMILIPETAYAATSYSNTGYATANGYQYVYYASCQSYSSSASGYMHVDVQNGQTAPTGYVGEYVYLYRYGNLVASTGWSYNSSPCAGYTISAHGNGTGNYHAVGYARFYNGSGYNGSSACTTPIVQTSSKSSSSDFLAAYNDIDVSLISLIEDTDCPLIPAEGIHGEVGFVSRADLGFDQVPASPEEALAYTESQPAIRYIPVYKQDGVTVVDEFPICRNVVSE